MAPLQDKNEIRTLSHDDVEPQLEGEKPVIKQLKAEQSVIADILAENNVYLGGASMGKGFRRAARHLLRSEHAKLMADPAFQGSSELAAKVSIEDPFFVCDLGVVVAQFYQWKRHFPRVHPYYAVKCNPDPVIVKTLATLGANFDCASRNEIKLVEECSAHLEKKPDIIFANPCKARSHVIYAAQKNIFKVTFDNVSEVAKCAAISKDIKLIMRIITDDSGSQCRLSSKFGAPRKHWKQLLRAAKNQGLEVVGVSFHVGSGCRDATRYEMALRDAREVIDMGKSEFGFNMNILDIGGGFPGETHSLWDPSNLDPEEAAVVEEEEEEEGEDEEDEEARPFMYFSDIADLITPLLDEIFPESGIRIIGEPGRYLVAASSTLVVAVTSIRNNILDESEEPVAISDREASKMVFAATREEENTIITNHGASEHPMIDAIMEQLGDYSQMFARQQLAQQEMDCMLDASVSGLLDFTDGSGRREQNSKKHTVEGITAGLIEECMDQNNTRPRSLSVESESPGLALASAGEAVISGVVKQAMVDAGAATDDFAYYVNDGVYGAFNNLMFDHAIVRPRMLRSNPLKPNTHKKQFEHQGSADSDKGSKSDDLFSSTIFGPTCDSIDVLCRSVLLPRLEIGDWLYFENMGAYTSAASSSFNGFEPSKKMYVCSVLPESL